MKSQTPVTDGVFNYLNAHAFGFRGARPARVIASGAWLEMSSDSFVAICAERPETSQSRELFGIPIHVSLNVSTGYALHGWRA